MEWSWWITHEHRSTFSMSVSNLIRRTFPSSLLPVLRCPGRWFSAMFFQNKPLLGWQRANGSPVEPRAWVITHWAYSMTPRIDFTEGADEIGIFAVAGWMHREISEQSDMIMINLTTCYGMPNLFFPIVDLSRLFRTTVIKEFKNSGRQNEESHMTPICRGSRSFWKVSEQIDWSYMRPDHHARVNTTLQ